MTPEQIEQLARECIAEDWCDHIPGYYREMNLTRFAELVAQAERERCVLVAKNYPRADGWIAEEIAAAIRNSKQGGEVG